MKPLLNLSHVWAGYPHAPILKNLSLRLGKASMYGVLGEEGAGKSTLLRVIAGQIPITKGEMHWYDGISAESPATSYLLETPRLYQNLSIREHVNLFRGFYQVSLPQAEQWLQEVGLSPTADQKIKDCSTSSLKRLGLVIALLSDPRLVLIDEPERDLAPAQQTRFYQIIRKLLKYRDASFLVTSQQSELIEHWSDQVGVLHQGQIVWEGSPEKAPASAVFVFRPRAKPLIQQLLQQKQLPFEWLDQERVKVQVRWKSDISMLAKHLVMHGIELLGIEQRPSALSDIVAMHAPSLRA